MIELLPCPFKCENPKSIKPEVESERMNDGFTPSLLWLVRCPHCDATGPASDSKEESIKSWNNRI